MPEEHVRVIVGELLSKEMLIEHAWVEVKCDGTWFQQDAKDNIAFLNLDSLKIEIITIHL
jgi:hypothetical protein